MSNPMETNGVRPSQVRRALARVERGAAIDPAEATALLDARGAQLDELCSVAARVRDAGLVAAGQLQRSGRDMFLSPDEILAIASQGRGTGLPRGAVHPWRPAGDLPCLTSHALQRVLDAAARHHSAVLADRSGTGSTPLTTAPGCLRAAPVRRRVPPSARCDR